MKRIVLIAAIFCTALMVLESCSPKTTTGTTAVRRGDVSGNWVVNDITFDGIPELAIKGFLGESSYKCFIGSTWNLTNSGNGIYTTSASSPCAGSSQTIFWSVNAAEGVFQFKKIYEGDKAKNVTDGYKLQLASSDGNNMVIKSPIEYGNRTAYVVLNFSKAAK